MKKIILAVFTLACSVYAIASDPGVDEKVLAAFNKTFQQAKDVTWTESGDNYQVKFTQNDIASRVYYDREGNILKTFRYYEEQGLPLLILSKIKSKFSDCKIHGVVEISSEIGTYYYITIHNSTHWMEIKSDSYGSMSREKKFKKG